MKLEVEVRTNHVSLEGWRSAYHSDAFNRIVAEEMKLRERAVIEHVTLPDGTQRTSTRVVPNIKVPAPVRKLIGGHEIAYTEITTFDPVTRAGRLTIENEAGDAVQVGGDIRFHVDGGGVRMQLIGTIKVKVFGLGGLIERLIASEVRKRYAAIEPLLQRFVDEQGVVDA